MLSRFARISLMALALAAVGTALPVLADEAKAPAKGDKAKAGEHAKAPAKLGGGLDQLDLAETQKADILKLRADLKAPLADLRAQMKKLEDDEKAKELAVLTPDQQAKLKAIQEAATPKKGDKPAGDKPKTDAATTAPATVPAK